MLISDWSSDVCSSDLFGLCGAAVAVEDIAQHVFGQQCPVMLIPRYANSILDHIPNLRFGFRVTAALAQAFGVIHARQQRHRMIRTECCGFAIEDRKSVVLGKSVSVSVDLGGRSIIKQKNSYKRILVYNIHTMQ